MRNKGTGPAALMEQCQSSRARKAGQKEGARGLTKVLASCNDGVTPEQLGKEARAACAGDVVPGAVTCSLRWTCVRVGDRISGPAAVME